MRAAAPLVLLFFLVSTSLSGQSALGGTVSDTLGKPIEGADVVVQPGGLAARSNARGIFFLGSVAPGSRLILVRHPGHVPLTVELDFRAGDTVLVDFEMIPGPQVLPELAVVGAAAPPRAPSLHLAEFEDRRKLNVGGHFIGPDEVHARDHSTLPDLLRKIPGIKLVFHKGAIALASMRPASAGGTIRWADRWPNACYSQIYLDGVALWFRGQTGSTPYDINKHQVHDLEAIEYYQAASTPIRFAGTTAACGTLLMWSRERGVP